MNLQEAWISRPFRFDFGVDRITVILSRLRGTRDRIARAVVGLGHDPLTARPSEAWSIQEHVGHLHDLEALHLLRLDELARGQAVLSPADMANRLTWDARHNDRPFATVFGAFTEGRATLLDRLARLDRDGLSAAGLHPRLQTPMRAVDVGFFTAEHDDHHVARIEALVANR